MNFICYVTLPYYNTICFLMRVADCWLLTQYSFSLPFVLRGLILYRGMILYFVRHSVSLALIPVMGGHVTSLWPLFIHTYNGSHWIKLSGKLFKSGETQPGKPLGFVIPGKWIKCMRMRAKD